VILDVFDLTPRERDVAQQVILGRSTGDIARSLHISGYTVQDHLKVVFKETGVGTRGQLSAKLFFEHDLPQPANPPLSTDGRLTEGLTS
jgi:DNA-binding CsgD family transcriptional regulator